MYSLRRSVRSNVLFRVMECSHQRFEKEQGGKVFIVFSVTEKGGRKRILNNEVLNQIFVMKLGG
ncbi:MAG: hypothetical protein RMK30_04735 [Anaerolineae bacterium]|nr:hypothetical protein [Anaerolineae bacterium]